MNTTDDVIGVLNDRITKLELKIEALTAVLDGVAFADSQWRNEIEAKLDRLGEPLYPARAAGRIG